MFDRINGRQMGLSDVFAIIARRVTDLRRNIFITEQIPDEIEQREG